MSLLAERNQDLRGGYNEYLELHRDLDDSTFRAEIDPGFGDALVDAQTNLRTLKRLSRCFSLMAPWYMGVPGVPDRPPPPERPGFPYHGQVKVTSTPTPWPPKRFRGLGPGQAEGDLQVKISPDYPSLVGLLDTVNSYHNNLYSHSRGTGARSHCAHLLNYILKNKQLLTRSRRSTDDSLPSRTDSNTDSLDLTATLNEDISHEAVQAFFENNPLHTITNQTLYLLYSKFTYIELKLSHNLTTSNKYPLQFVRKDIARITNELGQRGLDVNDPLVGRAIITIDAAAKSVQDAEWSNRYEKLKNGLLQEYANSPALRDR